MTMRLKNRPEDVETFCRTYLTNLDAEEAALASDGIPVTAAMAAKYLRHPDVATRLSQLKSQRVSRLEIDADQVLTETLRMAMADVGECFDDQGRLLPVKQMPIDIRRAVSSIKVVTRRQPGGDPEDVEYVAEIKLWDKNTSLERLFKHLGLYKRDNEQKTDFWTELIEKIRSDDAAGSRITPKG